MPVGALSTPFRIGAVTLPNRIIAPPHAALMGNLVGSEKEAERYISYWRSLAEGGTGLLIALNGVIDNIIPPGFDPSGVGARTKGSFRHPLFVERMSRLASDVQAAGAKVGTQIIMQGGTPHAPSATLSGPVINSIPHPLTRREIAKLVQEYRVAAEQALAAGLDVVELHANHDDIIEWFLSPLTNGRVDEYGGTFERRMAFLGEILSEMRVGVGDELAIGVRLNMAEAEPGGYDFDGGLEIAGWLQQSGMVDYLHLVMGTGWGFPSYIQTWHFDDAQWAQQAGHFRRQLDLPIAYGGRVGRPEIAERVIAEGHADLVAVGRAHLADPAFARKALGLDERQLRPCIGTSDCINRTVGEGLPFACTVNPALGLGDRRPPDVTDAPRRLLVVGGGPAGLQLALTAAERGHAVQLWERSTRLGGQVRLAARLPGQAAYTELIEYQTARLDELGASVFTRREATLEAVLEAQVDVIAIATGAVARWPNLAGSQDARVFDMWQVLRDEASLGSRVAVVVQEDHAAPLALADMLGRQGRAVTLFIQTNGPAPLLSRYSTGTLLGRLSEAGVRLVFNEAVISIALPAIVTRHVYSRKESHFDGFDSVVLACGALPVADLYAGLEHRHPEVHLLGDAFAPRRMAFATQQGYALAKAL